MKKTLIFTLFLLLYSSTFAYNLPDKNFDNKSIANQYIKLEKNLSKYFDKEINSLSLENKDKFNNLISESIDLFYDLDYKISQKNKKEAWYTITKLAKKISEIIIFLKKTKNETKNLSIKDNINFELWNFTKKENHVDITYYADFFEWRNAANGNIFSHSYFSAAKCLVPFNTLTQVWLGNKSLIVKINDRPSCSRFPNLIDLSTIAFDYLFERYKWKQPWSYIELWVAPKDYYKMYINRDFFNWIILESSLPNTYLLNESIHINWEIIDWPKELTLHITSPKWDVISLKKNVEKYFSFSYPLEMLWTYKINFLWSDKQFNIEVLSWDLFNGKKFIKLDIPRNDNVEIKKDILWENVEKYRIFIWWKNYNMAEIIQDWKKFYISWIGDIIIPDSVIYWLDLNKSFVLNIKSSKTATNFSHDFHTEPVVIYNNEVILK